jgi:hypothetical protein
MSLYLVVKEAHVSNRTTLLSQANLLRNRETLPDFSSASYADGLKNLLVSHATAIGERVRAALECGGQKVRFKSYAGTFHSLEALMNST